LRDTTLALGNSPICEFDSDGRHLYAAQKFSAAFFALATVFTADPEHPRKGQLDVWNAALKAEEDMRAEAARRNLAPHVGPPVAGGKPGQLPTGAKFHVAQGVAWMFLVVGLEATFRSAFAAEYVSYGMRSDQGTTQYAVESSLINAAHGESAYADLDAIDAALLMTGGAGAAAVEAWDTYAEADELFSEAFGGVRLPGAATSE
jgi:hypothetical protein